MITRVFHQPPQINLTLTHFKVFFPTETRAHVIYLSTIGLKRVKRYLFNAAPRHARFHIYCNNKQHGRHTVLQIKVPILWPIAFARKRGGRFVSDPLHSYEAILLKI